MAAMNEENTDLKKMGKDTGDRWIGIVVFAVVFIISILPFLLYKGIPFGHDTSFHMSRIQSVYEAMLQGKFFVGVYADYFNGMGYGNGLFYPDFFLYIPAFFMVLGASGAVAYKLFLILLSLSMGLTMYFSVKKVWGSKEAALLSSALYMLSSYHLTDLFIRSTLGEITAFVFLPLVIAGVYEVLWGDRNWLWLSLGMGGVVLSHLLTSVITFVLCVILLAINWKAFKERPRLMALLKAAALALGLTAFFTLPFLEQMVKNPVWGDTGLLGSIADWAVAPWATILALPTTIGVQYVPPAGIGLFLTAVAVTGLVLGVKRKGERDPLVFQLLIMGFVLLLCATTIFPWHLLAGQLQTLQFPWRFYFFTTAFFAFCGGAVLKAIPPEKYQRAVILVVLIGTLGSYTYNLNAMCTTRSFVETNPYPSFSAGCEYLPKAMRYDVLMTKEADAASRMTREGYNEYTFSVNAPADVELPLVYYEGYSAWADGQPAAVYRTSGGFVGVHLTDGGTVTLKVIFTGTALRKASGIISLVTLAGGGVWFIIRKRGKKIGQ